MRPLRTSEFEHWHRVSMLAMVASIIGVGVDSRPENPNSFCRACPAATTTTGGALAAHHRRLSTGAIWPWPRCGTGATLWHCRSSPLVARKLQAGCKPVAGLLEPPPSLSRPLPGPRPGVVQPAEWRSVPQSAGIEYRPRKACQGYRDWTDSRMARNSLRSCAIRCCCY